VTSNRNNAHDDHHPARRDILKRTAAVTGALVTTNTLRARKNQPASSRGDLCLFSKPLHNRPVRDLPDLLHDLGIDALDLTVRPGGHVLPDRVEEDLPAAHEHLTKAGIRIPMITTGITDADKGNAKAIIETASKLGIRCAKLGYYRYGNLAKMADTLADVGRKLNAIAAMCRVHGVQAGFHNHSGGYVGAPLWDVWQLINPLPPEAIGSYFDIRHATVEGGDAAWRINMHRLAPRIVMMAVKDFRWHKTDKGWRVVNVPLGEGMIHLDQALHIAKAANFTGPVSLHMEYMHGGDHHPTLDSDADKTNLSAIRKDWQTLKSALKQTGLIR